MRWLEILRSRLLPPGTRMADVPPDHRGLTYHEWIELECLEYREAKKAGKEPHNTAVAITEADPQESLWERAS